MTLGLKPQLFQLAAVYLLASYFTLLTCFLTYEMEMLIYRL